MDEQISQEEDIRIGSLINYSGMEGAVVEIAGPMSRVKYKDGSFEWLPSEELKGILAASREKSAPCPFCKSGEAHELDILNSFGKSESMYECRKCSGRFSRHKQVEEKYRKKTYCKKCGKLSGKQVEKNKYHCESCDSYYQLN